MARSADKKVVASNASLLRYLRLALLAANALYLLLRLLWQWSSYSRSDLVWYLSSQTASVAVYRQLAAMAAPAYGAGGEIVSGGEDLLGSGMIVQIMLDLVYIGVFVTVGVIFSDRFWWTYSLIPLYGIYKAATSGLPLLKSLAGMAGGGDAGAMMQNGPGKGKKAAAPARRK
ncbi:hypothetical protein DFJ74DRAFT_679391 [Hyaloraphidium curvatum]|nr:hypothetical protein DFJ74DRAFT_679391 [Hyaloraphidium curvatum]